MPELKRALDDPIRDVRLSAATCLDASGVDDPRIVDVYLEALNTGNRENLLRVAVPLVEHASRKGSSGLPFERLVEILSDEDHRSGLDLEKCRSAIGSPGGQLRSRRQRRQRRVPAGNLRRYGDQSLRGNAINALGCVAANEYNSGACCAALKDESPHVRRCL